MVGFAVALFGALSAAGAGVLAETASGVVFEDRDGDGRRDRGEPGVADVAVSNGREVVRSDAEGRYRIDVPERSTLFVSKPSGYATPLDADGLPQFYYRHVPDGTDPALGLRYPGIEPTGPLPSTIDFPLRRVDEPEDYDVLLFADTQPQGRREIGYIRDDVLAEVADIEAAFGITLGDIMYDDLSLFPRFNRLIGSLGLPWYNVPGNHELNFLSPDDEHSLETFQRYFGPAYYSFDVGRVHYVVLDDVDYLGKDAGFDPPHLRGKGQYEGRLGERQLGWLEQDLRGVPRDRLIVLAMHIPLGNYIAPEAAGIRVADRRQLFAILDGRPALALAGHLHVTEHHYFGADEGWKGGEPLHAHTLATVSGSWWSGPMDARGIPVSEQRDGTPNGYHIMQVRGNRATLRYRAAGAAPDFQMRIQLDSSFHRRSERIPPAPSMQSPEPQALELAALAATDLYVNLFDGGPRSEVWFRIDDGPERPMRRVAEVDPYVQALFQRHAATMKSWVEPLQSSHLWRAKLPSGIEVGAHTIRVRAIDDYGQQHRATRLFEVVDGSP